MPPMSAKKVCAPAATCICWFSPASQDGMVWQPPTAAKNLGIVTFQSATCPMPQWRDRNEGQEEADKTSRDAADREGDP